MKNNKNINPSLFSMTGYGSYNVTKQDLTINIEIKSFNSRFLDQNLKLPKEYSSIEHELRNLVSGKLNRGRIDIFIRRKFTGEHLEEYSLNSGLLNNYLNLYKQACAVSDVQAEIDEELIRSIFIGRDILEIESSEITTEEKTLVTNALSKAIESLLESRAEEGVKLTEDILHRLSLLEKLFSSTAALAENNAELQKQKLLDRVSKLANLGELEPGRLETEVAFLADKLDITEELVRGKSHLAKFREIVSQPPHGKKLDFILQEIGRELNTIASKAQNSEIQSLIVEAKGECERIKEQIQNIE